MRCRPVAAVVMAVAIGLTALVPTASSAGTSATIAPELVRKCVAGSKQAAVLNAFFAANNAAGLSGEDYPRAYRINDSTTLWMFQDAFRGVDARLIGDGFGHNLGIIQRGDCFSGPLKAPNLNKSWIGYATEVVSTRWFWPLDGAMGADGYLHLFLARMVNPRHTGAAIGALPRETWEAVIRPSDLRILSLTRAKNPGTKLYGYSIVDDGEYSYLYGYCNRQFDPAFLLGINPCENNVYVARVPKGRFRATYTYWDGSGWNTDPATAVAVMNGGAPGQVNPPSVRRIGNRYVNVYKEGDWWGKRLYVYTAFRPEGPWVESSSMALAPDHGSETTYGASVMPWLDPSTGQLVIAHANFVWDVSRAMRNGRLYRVSFLNLPVPDPPTARQIRAARRQRG